MPGDALTPENAALWLNIFNFGGFFGGGSTLALGAFLEQQHTPVK